MNELKRINSFFNRLRCHSGAVWVENETVMLSAPEQFQNKRTYEFISNNKKIISQILKSNQIGSKEKFLSTIIFKHNLSGFYPLSPAQERLWFIEHFEEGTNAYHIPSIYELAVTTDIEGVKYALQQIILRHEVLRTTIIQPDDTDHGVQIVHEDIPGLEVRIVNDNDKLESLIIEEINRPFNLSTEFPIRIKFYKIYSTVDYQKNQTDKTVLLVNLHHIAGDGWSIDIFQNELETYYDKWVEGNRTFKMPELEIQYKDFSLWQKTYLEGEILDNQINYWKEKLTGFQYLEFPADYVRPGKIDYKGKTQSFELNKDLSNKLRKISRKNGTTLHSVLLSSLSILLGKYTGQDDIITGSPIANRHLRQTEGLIGFFVNTQANRVLLKSTERFDELIKRVHQDQIEAQIHQDLPFEKLVNELGIERDTSRHPVFQVMFSVQNFGNRIREKGKSLDYISVYKIEDSYEIEKFDLSFFIDDHLEYLKIRISYATSLFEKETIERLTTNFKYLLEQLSTSGDKPYSQISIISPADYELIVNKWNDRDKEYSKVKTINQFFIEQALRTPDNIALVYAGMQISYRELNEKSNQLSRHISAVYAERTGKDIIPGTIIAICLDRCPEMVVGILAILKSGGAYLPLDPGYPFERINYMLDETDTRLILSSKQLIENTAVKLSLDKVVWIDLTEQLYHTNSKSDLQFYSKPEDLIYVIYTSGTTGNPKGVMVEHRAVASLVYSDIIDISDSDVFAFFSAPVFDAATFELWMPLLNGNTLIIPRNLNDIIDDPVVFKQFLLANKISILFLTTTLFESLYYSDVSIFNSLKFLLTGGEALDKNTVNKLLISNNKPWQFINGYGPTESTTFATVYKFTNPVTSVNVPIGKPICNRKVYILDSSLAPVPIGVKGELFISGSGLARGYVNCTEMTSERFIKNPFTIKKNDITGSNRLYKTGDLARWLPDGNLEFLGRNDGQVKIRGFRIEIGEIEHALGQINGILKSCVLLKEINTESGTNKYLAGYYVPVANVSKISQAAIIEQLCAFLPEYMIPEIFIEMEDFPLTVNGKLDRKALPDPDFSSSLFEYIAPGTETECDVCRIWQTVLGIEHVGITDDFFKIGGNSILAIQVAHRISKIPGLHVKVADIFKFKSISCLLHNIAGRTHINIPKTHLSNAALSFAQERLWFIEQYEPGTNAYNIPALFELDKDTDISGIIYALHQIVFRHEVLRTTIVQQPGMKSGFQTVHNSSISIEEITVSDKASLDSLLRKDMDRPFNLSNDFPVRATLYHLARPDLLVDNPQAKCILLVNMHHIASDGWSVDIFLRELNSYYEAFIKGDNSFRLPELEIQYIDYAVWQRTYLTGEILVKQMGYWMSKLTGFQPLVMPTDFHRPAKIDYRGANQSFAISKQISKKLRNLARRNGTTLNTVLLASLNIMLGKYTGQEDIITGSPIANRHHKQTDGLIGFFVNTQANRTILNKFQSFEELIVQVHQDQVQAQSHQDLPFEKLVEALGVERDLTRHPVFQVMFGVQDFGKQNKPGQGKKTYLKEYNTEQEYEIEKFDMSVFFNDGDEEIVGNVSFATSLFKKDTIINFINQYILLIERLTDLLNIPYSQISLLSPDEFDQIIVKWNDTETDCPEGKTIQQIFQEQAADTPDNICLVYEGSSLTYKEVDEKSNQLARYIRAQYLQRTGKNLQPDTIIALCLKRSPEIIIGILGVVKAGGAYLPIDPTYPQDRFNYILEDTGVEIILSHRHLSIGNKLDLPADKVIPIDLSENLYLSESIAGLQQFSDSKNLAYIIYTSGTTGRPKGVMIEHASLINLMTDILLKYKFLQPERATLFSNYVFDASVEQIFVTLFSGSTLFILDDKTISDAESFVNYIIENQITHLDGTPSFFSTIDPANFRNVKRIIFGGEYLSRQLFEKFSAAIPMVLNAYGPTEATVACIISQNTDKLCRATIQNTKIYILDSCLNPVPVGVAGELYVGGAGLARGYLNLPELTRERFVANPFATETDKRKGFTRMYKTGDLVKWNADSTIEYLGRNDEQVKIRGYRIELGEIEQALLSCTGISQSCVVAKERVIESGIHKYLVGYYAAEHIIGESTILEQLSKILPEYMVPAILVKLESFPLTINGKLDKRALPEPDFGDNAGAALPVNELEKKLVQIYSEVLGIGAGQIRPQQNFFRMGGNSILSIQLKQKLNQVPEFNHITVADLFKYNTIEKLVQSIGGDKPDGYIMQKAEQPGPNHEIAIIGVSGAFSGADSVADLWHLVSTQQEGIKIYSKEELRAISADETLVSNPSFIPVSGKVSGTDLFDPIFWDLSPNEAREMDPQIRKFIEHCWYALESSGYSVGRRERHIGVFAGSGSNNYFQDHVLNGEQAGQVNAWEASMSNIKDALATKTAYLLGLTGPANSINTACSTGLVAVVEACQKLQLGVCSMALAGGVSLIMPDHAGYEYQEGMILSRDGHCRTFDVGSSGTTPGSGAGVLLLKRLEEAIRDKDPVLGVIKGYATNNDGDRKSGYTAPSVTGQSECIIMAQKMAGITSGQIDYVECHGTATQLGDPIEVRALSEAFRFNSSKEERGPHKTILGAVKANIGHTDSAAGVAGLVKVVSMLAHNILPGQANYRAPNPELELDKTCFEISKENRPWHPAAGKQRLAGVSSFGIGGTNAHVIIGDYRTAELPAEREEPREPVKYIIGFSAKTRTSLDLMKQALLKYLSSAKESDSLPVIGDIAYTLQERREHYVHRMSVCASDTEELRVLLSSEVPSGRANTEGINKLVFMFPGQGTQYRGMAKQLYEQAPYYRSTADECLKLAGKYTATDIGAMILGTGEARGSAIDETENAQIALYITSYALAKYLEHLGIKADGYLGHSIGEYVAATLCGVFTPEDAISAVISRGRLMQSMQPGSMLAINASEDTVREAAERYNCEISVLNSPEDIVVSGRETDIKALKQDLDDQGIAAVELNTSHGYHSVMMEAAASEFETVIRGMRLSRPEKDFISNVSGAIAGEEVMQPQYWSRQLRKVVRFSEGVSALITKYNHQVTFIEAGAGKGLSYFIGKQHYSSISQSINTVQLLASAKESAGVQSGSNASARETILSRLWLSGVISHPNETGVFKHSKLLTGLPVYQFDFQKTWLNRSTISKSKVYNGLEELYYERYWESNLKSSPWQAGHLQHKNILVLINESGSAAGKAAELLELLESNCESVSYAYHEPQAGSESVRAINFSDAEQIGSILTLKSRHKAIDTLVYISSGTDIGNAGLDIFAVRNIFDQAAGHRIRIPQFISVSFDNYEVIGTETLQAHPGLISGVTKSIPYEYATSGTKALHIDVSLQDRGYEHTFLTVVAKGSEKDLIAIRGSYYWTPTYHQVKIGAAGIKAANGRYSGGGVYLITGGLGGVGYACAEYLTSARDKTNTVILTGRTSEGALSGESVKKLDRLRKTCHRIIYASMDIGHAEAGRKMRDLLTAYNISGIETVIHTAAVMAENVMYEKTNSGIDQVVATKVRGVESLIRLSADIPIHNLVCCSSLASILPSLGQMEYTAANVYLDEISFRRYKGIDLMLTISINQISDTGAAIDFIEKSTSKAGKISNSIKSYEFPAILEKLLQSGTGKNICLSRYDLNGECQEHALRAIKPDITIKFGEIKITDKEYTETEYKIARLFGEVLGIDKVSVHDDFFRLGGNSILAIKLSHLMGKELDCVIKVADVFRLKSIKELSKIINILHVNKLNVELEF